jgi:Leucine-rich repeat (LRR) protein
MKNKAVYLLLFVFSLPLLAEEKILISIITPKGTIVKESSKGTDALYIDSSEVNSIDGLEQLTNLRKITFIFDHAIKSFSYLEKCPLLESIIINTCSEMGSIPDITKFPKLRSFEIRIDKDLGSNKSIYTLDLANNPRLEYLQIADCNLTKFPKLTNIPPSLKYVNFSGNLIESIDEDSLRALRNVRVFVADNLLQERDYARYGNVGFSLEKMWKILPPEFMETY